MAHESSNNNSSSPTSNANAANAANSASPGSSWTEPPWQGWIETTGDALLILEAARRGLIPRVTRRLVDSERKMITSGSVFVFDEDESGIKRWTDGFFWSPSRILGNFLLYRETEKRSHRSARAEHQAQAHQGGQQQQQQQQGETEGGSGTQYNVEGAKMESQTLSRPKGESSRLGIDRQRERVLVGSLTNSYKFKPGGMMKKVRIHFVYSPLRPLWERFHLCLESIMFRYPKVLCVPLGAMHTRHSLLPARRCMPPLYLGSVSLSFCSLSGIQNRSPGHALPPDLFMIFERCHVTISHHIRSSTTYPSFHSSSLPLPSHVQSSTDIPSRLPSDGLETSRWSGGRAMRCGYDMT